MTTIAHESLEAGSRCGTKEDSDQDRDVQKNDEKVDRKR